MGSISIFSTVGENIVHDLLKNSTNASCNLSDFKNYSPVPVKNKKEQNKAFEPLDPAYASSLQHFHLLRCPCI